MRMLVEKALKCTEASRIAFGHRWDQIRYRSQLDFWFQWPVLIEGPGHQSKLQPVHFPCKSRRLSPFHAGRPSLLSSLASILEKSHVDLSHLATCSRTRSASGACDPTRFLWGFFGCSTILGSWLWDMVTKPASVCCFRKCFPPLLLPSTILSLGAACGPISFDAHVPSALEPHHLITRLCIPVPRAVRSGNQVPFQIQVARRGDNRPAV